MNALFALIKNETASSGIPEATRHCSNSDIIRPGYKRHSGFFGVCAGACIRQNTVYNNFTINSYNNHGYHICSCDGWIITSPGILPGVPHIGIL